MGPKGLKNSDEELKHGFSVKALILNKLFIKIPTSIKKKQPEMEAGDIS